MNTQHPNQRAVRLTHTVTGVVIEEASVNKASQAANIPYVTLREAVRLGRDLCKGYRVERL